MIEELTIINHWVESRNINYLKQIGLEPSYFFVCGDIVRWINDYTRETKMTPSHDLLLMKFDDYKRLEQLDSDSHAAYVLKQQRAYVELRSILEKSSTLFNNGQSIEAMTEMKKSFETLIAKFAKKVSRYEWVEKAKERYELYMEKHGQEGLAGISTGLQTLDDLTGGWKNDDLILLTARMNEGKSLLATFFAYQVWLSFKKARIKDPVVLITTEMPELEVALRLDTMRSHLSNRKLNEGRLEDPEIYREYLETLKSEENEFIILSEESNGGRAFRPSDIYSVIEDLKPGFLVIDQLYDIEDDSRERDIRKRIVNVTNDIRDINLTTLTPTLIVSQAGRGAAKEAKKNSEATPELEHVQESDAPAQKATRVIAIKQLDDVFKLTLRKNRGGEKNKDIIVKSDIDSGYYYEISENERAF